MRKEISSELYNYNKFPGPEFHLVGKKVLTDKLEFNLVDNYKEGFDVTAFNQRFSEILTKFDYIVGDWGNEQLRLRGFYKDDKAGDSTEKISRLEDYLLEYCNYGCAYFVLENPKPQRAAFDKKSHRKKENEGRPRRAKSDRSQREREQENRFKRSNRKQNKQQKPKKKKTENKKTDKNRHFVIRQK